MTESPQHPSAPVVVPRWEWRTFGDLGRVDEVLSAAAAPAQLQDSDEHYVLSAYGDSSVKVRGGLMDTKVLQQVDGEGLQLWVPTMKAPFPIDQAAVAAMFSALGAPLPALDRAEYTLEELDRELVAPSDDLRLCHVVKRRARSILEGCMVERTEFTVDGTTTLTVAVESPDQALVVATVAALGLAGRRNACVARGLKELSGWQPRRFAVVDVGTNSVKLHVGERAPDGTEHVVQDRAVVTRLGEGLVENGRLMRPAVERTVEAVGELVEQAREGGPADVVAVGTAGLRQAPNRGEFLQAAFARTGVVVEVISGQDEARLAYLAAVSSLAVGAGRLLVFDSGGGSSQFTFGTVERIEEQFSLDIGAVLLTERFGLDQAVSPARVQEALAAAAEHLAPVAGHARPERVLGMGGTSTNLAAVSHALARYDPDVVHGTVLDLTEIDRQIEVYRSRTADQRREVVGLQRARAEVVLAGACIVRTVLTLSGQDSVTVSDRGLRHGVVAERFGG